MSCFLKFCSAFVLWICGWRGADLDLLENASGDVVLAMQHTTYWDYILGCLYMWTYGIGDRCRFIMAGRVANRFSWASWVFRRTGCIYVPDSDKRPQGSLQCIVEQLKRDPQPRKIILISPNGSTKGGEWRSGWYQLARLLEAKIGIVGVDFHPFRRNVKLIDSFIDPKFVSYDEAERLAKIQMGLIFPKFPENSSVHVSERVVRRLPITRIHTPAIDPVTASAALLFVPCGFCWWSGCHDLALGGFFTAFCSVMYHRSHESSQFWSIADAISAKSTLGWFWVRALLNHCMSDLAEFLALFIGVVFFYLLGIGRHKHPLRTQRYILFHTIWHLFTAAFIIFYCCTMVGKNCISEHEVHIHYIIGNFRDEL